MSDVGSMRKRRSFTLKVIAACFVFLMLLRSDWLAAIFINSSQSSYSVQNNLLPHDLMQSNDDADRRENIVRELLEKEKQSSACPIPHLKNNIKSNKTAHCRRIQPFRSSCKVAEELFGNPLHLDIRKACRTHHEREFCRIMGSVDKWKVSCDISICDKNIFLGIKDLTSGKLRWTPYKKNTELQTAIQSLTGKSNFGYCLITCAKQQPEFAQRERDYFDMSQDEQEVATDSAEPQILNLPPKHPELKTDVDNQKKLINFNIIFIDSVARHHFFRSLPRSVKKLDEIAAGNKYKKELVLDFELVQGVRSRTFETLQSLFSGSINPFEKPFGTLEMPREKLKIETLVKPLKNLGYRSLWLEDLCPYWEWGLSKDLLVYNRTLKRETLYRKFIDRLRRAGIDEFGNTFSSCDILDANDVPDPFHAPDKICYNGKHQHEYTLSYLETYQRVMTHRSQPFISFFETNVGHEGTGKRIQYLDSAFSHYLSFAKDMTNTLTLILSDHGNAYGEFLNKAIEGRIEIFHPLLFMIIPEGVQSFFTENQLQALQINQNRLISVLDLHYTLTYIIEQLHKTSESDTHFKSDISDFNKQFNVSRYGLLSEISPERSCSHMPRIKPNACICDGYDVSLSNKAYHFILAAYFVGMLNNNIQKSKLAGEKLNNSGIHSRSKRQYGGFGNCQRMKVKKIKNIQESKPDKNQMTAKMDLFVETEGQSVDEIFFISIQMSKDFGFSFSSFDRITPYSKYSECADPGVDVKICVCKVQSETSTSYNSLGKHNTREAGDVLESMLYSELTENITSISVNGKDCLYIVSQSNKAGIFYEVFSICKIKLKVKFLFEPVNLVLSSGSSVEIDVLPYDITFVTAGVSEVGTVWSCDLTVSFNM